MGKNYHFALSTPLKFIGVAFFLLLAIPSFGTTGDKHLKNSKDQSITLDRNQLEIELGRKLSFKERIAFRILKSSKKKNKPNDSAAPTDGLGIASMVLGILALITGFSGILLGVLAVVFGAIALVRIQKGATSGRGMAIAGLICGLIGVILWASLFTLLILTGGFI